MILEPKLLVCDEAVSALDVSVQAQILELLQRLKREYGTSDPVHQPQPRRGAQLCERVLVLYLGRMMEPGPPASLFAAPRHPYTRRSARCGAAADPDAAAARGWRAPLRRRAAVAASHRPRGCVFHTRCPATRSSVCRAHVQRRKRSDDSRQVACQRWRELD